MPFLALILLAHLFLSCQADTRNGKNKGIVIGAISLKEIQLHSSQRFDNLKELEDHYLLYLRKELEISKHLKISQKSKYDDTNLKIDLVVKSTGQYEMKIIQIVGDEALKKFIIDHFKQIKEFKSLPRPMESLRVEITVLTSK